MLFWKQQLILLLSATISVVTRSQTLSLSLTDTTCAKTKITDSVAPSQLPHKRGTIILGPPAEESKLLT